MIGALLLTVTPAAGRTAPQASDVALFVVAAVALWFVRRQLRDRFRRRNRDR